MRRIQDKQDLDLERDPALRHSPAIMLQESGFLGIKHAISYKQGSSLEPQGMRREMGRGKKCDYLCISLNAIEKERAKKQLPKLGCGERKRDIETSLICLLPATQELGIFTKQILLGIYRDQ